MVFWLAVLMGALFAWIAIQNGFYATWILLFNLVLAAYMAVFLTPVVIAGIPAATTTPYGYALAFLVVAGAALLIMYGLCLACLSGRLRIRFPKVCDNVFAGLLGFLAGFLVFSFLGLTFCLTPWSRIELVRSFGFDAESQQTNTAYVCWWCDRFHGLVARSDSPATNARKQVADLLETAQRAGADIVSPSAATAPVFSPEPSEAGKSGATRKSKATSSPPVGRSGTSSAR
jgi:hypothetical protein